MRKYATEIAPVIDAVHVNVHAASHAAGTELARAHGITPGLLVDLRIALPMRPLTRQALAAVYRYTEPAELDAELAGHLEQGTLAEDGGALRATGRTIVFIDALYDLHAAATERIWAGQDVRPLADLVERALARSQRPRGGALEAMAPPYEPDGAPPGLLLFNRLAALRYHRADAHALSWQEAGLAARDIVTLRGGPLRERVEDETNRRAAQPYETFTEQERELLLEGLLKLA